MRAPHRSIKRSFAKNTGFPVGVLMSLHANGAFYLWPGSFDATSVRAQDRITVHLNAGDVVLFHGALVHEGAGYEGAAGEYHMRLHFYTQSVHGPNAWPIADETERIALV
jgi:ectoine hydroxylase-related dioxygenase (phytanoyl-CoA dioxygenase family)